MQIKWNQGLIQSIALDGIQGHGWGAETADRQSFFTLTERPRGCGIERLSCAPSSNGFQTYFETTMAEGHWLMKFNTSVESRCVQINQIVTCVTDSVFQDLVIRFTFDKDSFDHAMIADRQIPHRNSNIWHQFPVQSMTLHGTHGIASIRVPACKTKNKFVQHLYVRDAPGLWIVHARLIPQEPCDLYWIRWGSRLGTLSLPDSWSRHVLKWPWLKSKLWYLSERLGGRPALQAQGLTRLLPGEVIGMEAECEFHDV